MKYIFEQTIEETEVSTEDGGMAKIVTIYPPDETTELFLRLQSWDETKEHNIFNKLIGERVRICVEVLD